MLLNKKNAIIHVEELDKKRKEFQEGKCLTEEEEAFIAGFISYVNERLLRSKGRGGPIHIVCWDLIRGPLATQRDVGVFSGENKRVCAALEERYLKSGYELTIGNDSHAVVTLEVVGAPIFSWLFCCFHEFIH